jgi:hypothetical protein
MGRHLQWFQLIPAIYNCRPTFQFKEKMYLVKPVPPLTLPTEGKIGALPLSTMPQRRMGGVEVKLQFFLLWH